MENEFVQARHERFNTPEGIIRTLAKRAAGVVPGRIVKLVRGYDNEVYLVETGLSAGPGVRAGGGTGADAGAAQGPDVVVRIRHYGEVSFEQEAWAIEQCREKGVPVARLLLVDRISTPSGVREVMVQERLPGIPLSERLPHLAPADIRRALQNAGEVLGRIHSIRVGGFYHRHPDGRWDFPDWEGVMASHMRDRGRERPLLLQAGFTDSDVDDMLGLIEKLRREYPCRQAVLCHGDYLPEHILTVDDLEVTGVIDFGMCQGGDPAVDFAYLAVERPDLDLKPFLKGYGAPPGDGTLRTRIKLHAVPLMMGHLAHNIRIGDTRQAKELTQKLNAALREFHS